MELQPTHRVLRTLTRSVSEDASASEDVKRERERAVHGLRISDALRFLALRFGPSRWRSRPRSHCGLVWLVRWFRPLHVDQTAAVLAFRAEAIVKLTFCHCEPRGA